MLVTSATAIAAHVRRVMRRHVIATAIATIATIVLGALALAAVRAGLAGDPWPVASVVMVSTMLGAAIVCGIITVSVPSLVQAMVDVVRVNRQSIDQTETTLRQVRDEARHAAAESLAISQRLRTEFLARTERLALERSDQIRDLAVWLERMDFDMQRLGELIEKAREQGRADERESSRIREAHLRDAWAAEALRIQSEERAAARREMAGMLEAMRTGLQEELAAMIAQLQARSRTEGFAEGYVSGVSRRDDDEQK